MTYVSEARDDEQDYTQPDDKAEKVDASGFAISTASDAKSAADEVAEEHLDMRHEWIQSPLFPAAWPEHGDRVVVLYYPVALNPTDMNHGELHSAAVRVVLSLRDGTSEVETMKKRRLGEIEHSRPSRLEREELELSETALVRLILKHEDEDHGENHFWGYLKYFHEHQKLGRDMKKQIPEFSAWVQHLHDKGR
jgi:hypothetical protein